MNTINSYDYLTFNTINHQADTGEERQSLTVYLEGMRMGLSSIWPSSEWFRGQQTQVQRHHPVLNSILCWTELNWADIYDQSKYEACDCVNTSSSPYLKHSVSTHLSLLPSICERYCTFAGEEWHGTPSQPWQSYQSAVCWHWNIVFLCVFNKMQSYIHNDKLLKDFSWGVGVGWGHILHSLYSWGEKKNLFQFNLNPKPLHLKLSVFTALPHKAMHSREFQIHFSENLQNLFKHVMYLFF